MIYKDNKELSARYYGTKEILNVYRGLQLIWTAIKGCFSNSYWSNLSEWNNNTGWKN